LTKVSRVAALQDLVLLRVPPADAQRRLRAFVWDSNDALVTLTVEDLLRLLDEYLRGNLTNGDVEQWANAVEGRDDVGFEENREAVIKEMVFQLATPEITAPLTPAAALEWKRRLDQS
jgi:hypothetical protein